MQDRFRHGRCTEQQAFHAGQIVFPHVWMMNHHIDHCRNEQQMRDLMGFHQPDHRQRLETRHEVMYSAIPGHQKRHRVIGQMKHRRRVKVTRVFRGLRTGKQIQGIGHDIVMTEHHTLGPAGGATRIENTGDILTAANWFTPGLGRANQRFKIQQARWRLFLPNVDDVTDGLRSR